MTGRLLGPLPFVRFGDRAADPEDEQGGGQLAGLTPGLRLPAGGDLGGAQAGLGQVGQKDQQFLVGLDLAVADELRVNFGRQPRVFELFSRFDAFRLDSVGGLAGRRRQSREADPVSGLDDRERARDGSLGDAAEEPGPLLRSPLRAISNLAAARWRQEQNASFETACSARRLRMRRICTWHYTPHPGASAASSRRTQYRMFKAAETCG